MEVRILGAHQGEWTDGRFTSLLVDGQLAIDAGALTSTLTLAEQRRIRTILITHRHYDHIKDLPSFGFNMMTQTVVAVYGGPDVKEALERTLFSEEIWLNFFRGVGPGQPTMHFHPVQPGVPVTVDSYSILPIAINHPLPTVGYQVTGPEGRSIYYTADNGPGCSAYWAASNADVLITEVSLDSNEGELARRVGHLTPAFLADELVAYRQARGNLPRILVLHLNPFYEEGIRRELAEVSRRIGVEIEVGSAGMTLQV
ncbi:MAG: hypothetical protein HYY04_05970 [Chloroflexi bacterium]|nr:hypothetical protein [Chloroflexota bacterium]